MSRLRALYFRFEQLCTYGRSPLLLLIRLYWGWQFAQAGWGRLHNIAGATQFFMTLHIPLPGFNAVFVSLLEFVGGILLALGLGSRLIASLLAFDMVIAYVTADSDALKQVLSDPGKFYAADPFTFLAASLIVVVFGAGVFSIDYLLHGKREIGVAPADAFIA